MHNYQYAYIYIYICHPRRRRDCAIAGGRRPAGGAMATPHHSKADSFSAQRVALHVYIYIYIYMIVYTHN